MPEPDASGIGEFLAALTADAEQELAQRDDEARRESRALIDAAQADAARLECEPVEAQEPALTAEVARRLAAARLDAKRDARAAWEASFQDALRDLTGRLTALRAEASYGSVFAALLGEALAALPTAARLLVDPRDEDLALRCATQLDLDLSVEPLLETWGGVVVEDSDGRVVCNTLEERLANAEPVLRLEFNRIAAAGG